MVVMPLLAVFSILILLDSVLGVCSVDNLSRELRRVLSKSRLLAAKLDLTARDLSNQTESFQQDLQVSLRQAVGKILGFNKVLVGFKKIINSIKHLLILLIFRGQFP